MEYCVIIAKIRTKRNILIHVQDVVRTAPIRIRWSRDVWLAILILNTVGITFVPIAEQTNIYVKKLAIFIVTQSSTFMNVGVCHIHVSNLG